MKLMQLVRDGYAIDTILKDKTIISHGKNTVVLHGAAHRTWVHWRRKTWNIKREMVMRALNG